MGWAKTTISLGKDLGEKREKKQGPIYVEAVLPSLDGTSQGITSTVWFLPSISTSGSRKTQRHETGKGWHSQPTEAYWTEDCSSYVPLSEVPRSSGGTWTQVSRVLISWHLSGSQTEPCLPKSAFGSPYPRARSTILCISGTICSHRACAIYLQDAVCGVFSLASSWASYSLRIPAAALRA